MNTSQKKPADFDFKNNFLWVALAISLIVHAIPAAVSFTLPTPKSALNEKTLDVILVNSKSARKPTKAQALAQANLDGGGNLAEDRRATSPLPPSKKSQDGNELENQQKRAQILETKQQRLLSQTKSQYKIKPQIVQEPSNKTEPGISGHDLAQSALAAARLEAEIAKDTAEYNNRPRVKNLGVRTEEYRFAQYEEGWRNKVERVGTLNYPTEAKGKLYGSLLLTVRIKSDGHVEKIEINRSSGYSILDEAAKRIVQMAAPYAAFPPNIRQDTDVIEISRTWKFERGNQLKTQHN